MAVFEYRLYEIAPDKAQALHRRFRDHTLRIFERHGFGVVGFWEAVIGTTNELHYILRFDDLGHRERAWAGFYADEEWQRVRDESERDGPLTQRIQNQIWRDTGYSPTRKTG